MCVVERAEEIAMATSGLRRQVKQMTAEKEELLARIAELEVCAKGECWRKGARCVCAGVNASS